jgi:indole-3-acetate monooxygenase
MTETLERVRAAAPLISEEAAATETGGRLTDAVVDALRGAGVYRMTMSASRGGPELSPLDQIDVIEEVAAADGSAGWCAMINSDGGYASAYLDAAVASEMYPTLDLPTSVVAMPAGTATAAGDDYVVTGQWAFASGSPHCDWFFLNCLECDESGAMLPGSGGLPATRVVAVPAADVEILDTWHTTGLAGTASNDVRVDGVPVSRARSFSLFEGEALDPSPLYAWRWMFFVNLSAVPLGVARAALREAELVAGSKVSMPAMTLARDEPTVQVAFAQARALVGSARAYVHDTVGALWDGVSAGRPPTSPEWLDCRLALTNAFQASKQAVGMLYETLGTTGVYRKSPLDRQLRDVTTMSQHILCQTKTYAACGRGLLGLDPGAIAF